MNIPFIKTIYTFWSILCLYSKKRTIWIEEKRIKWDFWFCLFSNANKLKWWEKKMYTRTSHTTFFWSSIVKFIYDARRLRQTHEPCRAVCVCTLYTQISKTKRTMKSRCRGDRMEMYKLQEPAWTSTLIHMPIRFHSTGSTAFSAAIFFSLLPLSFVYKKNYRNFIRSHICVSPTSTGARSNFIKTCTSIPFGHIHYYIVRYFFLQGDQNETKLKTNARKKNNNKKTAAKLMADVIQINDVDREREKKKKNKRSAFNFIFLSVRFGIATMTYRLHTKWSLIRLLVIPFFLLFIIHWMHVLIEQQPHFRCISFVSPCSVHEICPRLAWFLSILTRPDKGIFEFIFFPFISVLFFLYFQYFFFGNHHFCGLYCLCVCVNICIVVRSHCIVSHRKGIVNFT